MKSIVSAVLGQETLISIDYIELADPGTLQPLDALGERLALLVAVRLGRTRLIDNLLIL